MAQTKHEIQDLLAAIGSKPHHRFGQNFMIDQNLVRLVAEAGNISSDDIVIEVGPGTGTLTEELLARAGKVIAVEIDRNLTELLRDKFAANEKFELIEGDALAGKHALNADIHAALRAGAKPQAAVKLVANLPYNIASPLAIEMLIAGVELLAFTVQKEVADRLRASASEEAYGPLSVMARMLSRVEILRTLPPQAFWPMPKIESALVRMTRENRLGDRAVEFSTFVHRIFSFRRKTLRKAFSLAEYDVKLLEQCGIDPQLRAENLTPQQFHQLFEAAET
ncbi:MAG TPA: 16S rRNA (adenine(1518)-N(6)/adenine(1519)-N(6))-dimethyltransferase RsmA [Tepidisphaeraceae bacterium]